ncbi:DUF1259 domain-containing protein [Cohnella algarum]|nr:MULTISPECIES: DUF1259 domain-containing protein [Cohnella]
MALTPSPLFRQFAAILQAQPQVINGVCTASAVRNNIKATILGKKTRSFLAIPQAFSFESVGRDGRALCLGETVILTEEINPFISRQLGGIDRRLDALSLRSDQELDCGASGCGDCDERGRGGFACPAERFSKPAVRPFPKPPSIGTLAERTGLGG